MPPIFYLKYSIHSDSVTDLPRSYTSLSSRKGWREGERGRDVWQIFFFKMEECLMTDDNAIFKSEFRPVDFADIEQNIACPHPVCQGETVSIQKMDFSNITEFNMLMLVSCLKSKKQPM